MLWSKSCPRCGGDLMRESDLTGGYDAVCIQCGHLAAAGYAATLPGWVAREPRRSERRRNAPSRAA